VRIIDSLKKINRQFETTMLFIGMLGSRSQVSQESDGIDHESQRAHEETVDVSAGVDDDGGQVSVALASS